MAKFTKLNIGDSVASSGGRVWKKLSSMLQLSAPTLSLNGDTLTITDKSGLATSFDILVDGVVKATATSTSFDLSALGLADGTYSISVIAKADGYIDSAESEVVSYKVASIVGTWLLNSSLSRPSQKITIGSADGVYGYFPTTLNNYPIQEKQVSKIEIPTSDLYFDSYSTSGGNVWMNSSKIVKMQYTLSPTNKSTSVEVTGSYKTQLLTFRFTKDIDNDILKQWLKANGTKTA